LQALFHPESLLAGYLLISLSQYVKKKHTHKKLANMPAKRKYKEDNATEPSKLSIPIASDGTFGVLLLYIVYKI
jgi:hypothetical protein